MNKKISAVSAIIFFMIVIVSCRQNKTTETSNALPVNMDDSSRAIIDRAIAYAGGNENWQQKKTLSFDKKSISYDSTGKTIREINQHFDYVIRPIFKAKATYMLGDTSITLLHDGEKARKLYNGKVSGEQNDIDGAWNSCFGSEYVMCMPFKLKDPGINTKYIGEVTLADGAPAQIVQASYIKGAGSNPGHIWYYYFEPGTGKLLANSFNGKNNYWDYTRYKQLDSTGGLLMPAIRVGYTADTLNKPGNMISESRSTNIVFDKDFPADYFEIKDGK